MAESGATVLGRDEERPSFVLQLFEVIPELAAQYGINPGGRFIQEDQLGIMHQRRGQAQPPLHTTGYLACQLVARVTQLDEVEQFFQPLAAPQAHAIDRAGEVQVLPHRQLGV
jgi:hypothetical protein